MADEKKPLEDQAEQLNDKPTVTEISASEQAAEPTKKRKKKPVISDEEYQRKKQEEVARLTTQIESKKQQTKTWWIKTILILLLCAFSVGIMLTLGNYIMDGKQISFSDMLAGIKVEYFLLLIGVILVDMLIESFKISYLLKISTGKFRLRNSMKAMFIGKYYDGVTPFATGGQPFQIYYLHKKDIPAGTATATPLVRFITYSFVWCIFALTMLCIAPAFLANSAGYTVPTYILVVAWIAVAVNFFVPIGVLIVSLFPKMGKRMIVGIVWLLSKLKIVKHKYKTNKKYVYEIGEYCAAIQALCKNWWKLIPLILLTLGEIILYAAIPFFTVIALANVQPTLPLFMQIIVLSIISQASANLIPTPGNSGALELTTTLAFVTVPGIESVIGWVILFWRFFTYYIYILTGIGINIFEIIRGAVRRKRAERTEQKN